MRLATLAMLALAVVALRRFRRDVRRDPYIGASSWGASGPHYTSNTGEDELVPMAAYIPVAARN